MKQYCRYCAHLCVGDANWCEKQEKTMSDNTAKRINTCKVFAFVELDAFDIDKKYKAREKKEEENIDVGQQELF